MRKIEFRAWDHDNKKMFDWIDIQSWVSAIEWDDMFANANMELMQFTGLSDKNGVKIFEGDVVNFQPEKGGSVTRNLEDNNFLVKSVGWNHEDGCWSWYQTNGDRQTAGYTFCKNNCDRIVEIIGNIHEHPELLKESA